MPPRKHLVNAQRGTQGDGGILLNWPQLASVEETTCLFLSVLGHWEVGCENINALECLGYPPAVVPLSIHSKGTWDVGEQVEHVCIWEAPELGAGCVAEEQCTQQLRLWHPKGYRISEDI